VAEAVLCAVKEISRLPEGRDALKSAGKSAIFGACLTVGSSSPQGAGPVVNSCLLLHFAYSAGLPSYILVKVQ